MFCGHTCWTGTCEGVYDDDNYARKTGRNHERQPKRRRHGRTVTAGTAVDAEGSDVHVAHQDQKMRARKDHGFYNDDYYSYYGDGYYPSDGVCQPCYECQYHDDIFEWAGDSSIKCQDVCEKPPNVFDDDYTDDYFSGDDDIMHVDCDSPAANVCGAMCTDCASGVLSPFTVMEGAGMVPGSPPLPAQPQNLMEEVMRCQNCLNACVRYFPCIGTEVSLSKGVSDDIPSFIQAIADSNMENYVTLKHLNAEAKELQAEMMRMLYSECHAGEAGEAVPSIP
jgi:hypothetical protein